ncbi:MAG: tetratricopeptide repeat protein [Spiribacter sp.]|nr:tetratricopeptide repeat protein [Spiribacter sp.]MDR9490100.1 tetratricopeptide repeat protein [Spiribacter sp.]
MAYEDEEQLEALKAWWQRNGRVIVIAAVVGLTSVLGWQQWSSWQDRQAAAAAADYQAVLSALSQNDREAATNRVVQLQQDYAKSTYAVLASLAVATAEMADANASDAAALLGWVSEAQPDSPMAPVARLRQAEALAAAGDNAAALAVLDPPIQGPLEARFYELRGDLELAQNDKEAAIEAYRSALQRSAGQRRSLVEVKLFDLGATLEASS